MDEWCCVMAAANAEALEELQKENKDLRAENERLKEELESAKKETSKKLIGLAEAISEFHNS